MISVEIRRKQHKPGLLQRLARIFTGPKKVKVGFPAGTDSDVLKVAVFNHFGTKGSGKGFNTPRGGGFGGPIPERPFLANAMRDNRGKYQDNMATAARAILRDDYDMRTALSKLGEVAVADIQREIVSLRTPPNSPVTIAIKGSDNPLVDTGRLHASPWWEIEE